MIPRWARLCCVLSNRYQPNAMTAITAMIWKSHARICGSVHTEPRGRGTLAVVCITALLEAPRPHGRAQGSLDQNNTRAPEPAHGGRWSAHWRCVLQTTLVPQGVEATLDLQIATGADIAIEGFGVVTHLLDDLHRPVLRQFQVLAELAFGAEQAGNIRVLGGFGGLDHVLRIDAQFLGIDSKNV